MNRSAIKFATLSLLSAGVLLLASCEPGEPEKPKAAPQPAAQAEPATPAVPAPPAQAALVRTGVTTQPGVAGGTVEDVFIATATVSAVDQATRKLTLKGADGNEAVFTAGPEIRNLPQVKIGDTVTATFARRITIVVRDDDKALGATHQAAAARALPGDKPGTLVAEELEVVARVKSIDAAARTAVLEYADGVTRTVPVRSDVDLSRYKAGDSVTTRVTTALTILVETP